MGFWGFGSGISWITQTICTYLPYRVSGSTLTAVGRSQLLARGPGTHSRILSWIQRAAQTVLGVYLKRTCSRVTSASSALGVLNDYALYKYTHSLTLTHALRQITTPTPHDSIFADRMLFLTPNQQCQSTEGNSTKGSNRP